MASATRLTAARRWWSGAAAASVAAGGVSLARCDAAPAAPAPEPRRRLRLRQAQVCFRHGARTPYRDVESAPRIRWEPDEVESKRRLDLAAIVVQPRSDATGLPVGAPLSAAEVEQIDLHFHPEPLDGGAKAARLTRVGMEQAVALGRELRAQYAQLVPQEWPLAQPMVLVRSTETERTIETAQGVLSGLFPGAITPEHPALVFIKAAQDKEWALPTFGRSCPRLQHLFQRAAKRLAAPEAPEARRLLAELQRHLDLAVPRDEHGAFTLSVYRDQLACRHVHGKAMPHGTADVGDALERLNRSDAEHLLQLFSGGDADTRDEATRLVAGRMLHRMVLALEGKAEQDRRLILYSAHDWSVAMLLLCLDPDGANPRGRIWPKFCASLAVECWEDEQDPRQRFVRVLLDGHPLLLPHLDAPEGLPPRTYSLQSLTDAMHRFRLADEDLETTCAPAEDQRAQAAGPHT
jgi:hypothetical protein